MKAIFLGKMGRSDHRGEKNGPFSSGTSGGQGAFPGGKLLRPCRRPPSPPLSGSGGACPGEAGRRSSPGRDSRRGVAAGQRLAGSAGGRSGSVRPAAGEAPAAMRRPSLCGGVGPPGQGGMSSLHPRGTLRLPGRGPGGTAPDRNGALPLHTRSQRRPVQPPGTALHSR